MLIVLIILGLILIPFALQSRNERDAQIVSAEVVDRTQIMREKYQHSGFSLSTRGSSRMYWRVKNVPSHVEAKVNVVYEDGRHAQLTLIEGSDRYNRIMSAYGTPKVISSKATSSKAVPAVGEALPTPSSQINYVEIKKNQLVAGVYVIGEAIPEGNYDFRWVWGHGSIHKYVDHTTTLGASNLFKWVGDRHDYEERILMNVVCKNGEYLHVDGNLIVEIRKSKPVEIDL